jgi:glycosyltransferase involved in cell wall biosynthesis
VTVHVIPTIPLRIVRWLTFYASSALIIFIIGRRTRPDVLYVREMVYNLFLLITPKLLGCPLITEVNGPILDEAMAIGAGQLELWLIRTTQRLLLRTSDRVVVVAEGLRDKIVKLHNLSLEKVAVIPNGTDTDHLRPDNLSTCQRAIGLLSGPVVGFVGSCYPYQDIDTLIKASPMILKGRPSTRFVIVGDGYMRPIWIETTRRERVADHFIFTGVVPYEKVPCYINAFTVCVALFALGRHEKIDRSPMKFYDYMACGRPVICTDLKGIGDFLRTHQAGIAVPPEDPKTLAEAILRLLNDEALCEEMGRRGREVVLKYYTWERVARDIVTVCGTLTDRG